MSSLLDRYAELVAEWGKKMNLVSDPEIRSIKAQHVDDCVRAYQCLTANLGAETVVELPIVDIGSGAGFPGVVWAILDPTTKTFLIEPREKRVTFLRHIAAKLQLKNIEVICSRFEDLPREQLPSRCLFTSRAVGYDAELIDRMINDVSGNRSLWAVMSGPESIIKLKNSVRRVVSESESLRDLELIQLCYGQQTEGSGRQVFVVKGK